METVVRTDSPVLGDGMSAASWASIAAGAVAIAALTLALLALGAGLGLSSISPWAGSGVSAATFKNATGIYLVLVAIMSSAIGGYLASRLRTKWVGLHTNEVFFRDTAHGFIAWAFATIISAGVLGAATTHILSGTAAGLGAAGTQAGQSVNPSQVYVDRLFRTEAAAPQASAPAGPDMARAEVTRLWTSSFAENADLAPPDRAYVARLVAARTGISQADAEKRVTDVVTEAKAAADRARRGAAKMAFWMTAYFLFGAFAASLAAVEGGQLRDGSWSNDRLTPRPWR
jgi:hypothetical protein